METKRRALGKGLEELFNTERLDINDIEEKIVTEASNEEIREIEISELRPNPYQPRKIFDEEALEELANSIKEHGVFTPIIVKKSIKGYEIIAGERRVKASELAGLSTIPAIVREFTDEQMMEIALLENLQRENLTILEEALAYNKLITKLNLTQDDLAKKVGKSRSYITNALGILTLPEEVKDMILEKKISMSHARTLSKLNDSKQIIDLANKIANDNINVRDLEVLTKDEKVEKRKPIATKNNNDYLSLENTLSEHLGTKVRVQNNKLMISFTNVNDLNRILEIMNLDKE